MSFCLKKKEEISVAIMIRYFIHSNVIWQKADFMMEIICIDRKNPLETLQALGVKTELLQLTMWELLLE